MILSDPVLAALRGQIIEISFSTLFLFIGLTACAIAAIRRSSGTRIFAWLGVWSGLYGAVQFSQSQVILAAGPQWLRIAAPYANTAMTYLLVVFGALSFRELSIGKLRTQLAVVVGAGLAIAAAGFAFYVLTGSRSKLMPYNNLLAAYVLVTLTAVVAAPGLSSRYLVLPERGVLAAGTLVFSIEALYNSVSRPLGFGTTRVLDHLGFAVLLFSFGYVALRLVLVNERRLLSVERELAIAREIQRSILPASVPELERVRVSAAYAPMTAVAGDLYEFMPVDPHRIGFLVADVAGHGVPAALIASMVKIAAHTVAPCASDPRAVLRGLNRVLSGQMRGQLISAAYLWLDTESGVALYSAAGHPPLLRLRDGVLERIESNGLLLGILPAYDAYPVHRMAIARGDRFLLYTDGVIEAEDAHGVSFGDQRLEHVLHRERACSPSELSDRLLAEIRQWQPANVSQQDDITLLVVDAV